MERHGQGKHPKYNEKMTHAVTERVLRSWCGVSNAYFWSAANAVKRAVELEAEHGQLSPVFTGDSGESGGSYSLVAHDSLMYGIEMSLKAAQMIDGYHEFNKDLGIPKFIENFEVNSLTYVYVRPTHRLDHIYRAETSDRMKTALEAVAPVDRLLEEIFRVVYSEMFGNLNWAPGSDHKHGDILHDSVRYTRHWMSGWLPPGFVMQVIEHFRRVNAVLPSWYLDPELKIPGC